METDRNGLEILHRDECLRLLATAGVGRIAVTVRALPVILPVNFLLDGSRIVIRTTAGTKLHAASAGAVVAFEVDEVDRFDHSGWSVSITGMAKVVVDLADLARIERLPLARWAPSPSDCVIAVSTDLMSGRRLRPAARALAR
jgi:nitroimidazol reductase NimA-like FMN-containing flavoprotein (pyridoxamine 5'-phosphate oxidase superfamily)